MLTKRQNQIYEFIKQCINDRGYSPTLKELCEHFGLRSVSTMHEHIEKLVDSGVIYKNDSGRVGIAERSGKSADEHNRLPLLGLIQAGQPVEEFENTEEKVDVPSSMCGKGLYALRVKGESMKEDHIIEGDIVIIDSKAVPGSGDTVVALVDDYETTLKRYFPQQDGNIRLQPANQDFEPIIVSSDRVRIQGVLKGVIREI